MLCRRALAVALSLAVGCGLGACGGGAGGETAATATAGRVPPPLRRALAGAMASGVPVRIPRRLLHRPPGGAEQAEVLRSPPDSYTLGLTRGPGCHLRSSCTTAIFSGFGAGAELPEGRHVALATGITGAYVGGECGPGCRFGTVEWRQGPHLYGLGVARAPLRRLVELADEAIRAAPITSATAP